MSPASSIGSIGYGKNEAVSVPPGSINKTSDGSTGGNRTIGSTIEDHTHQESFEQTRPPGSQGTSDIESIDNASVKKDGTNKKPWEDISDKRTLPYYLTEPESYPY